MFDTADMFLWMFASTRAVGLLLMLPYFMVSAVPRIMRVAMASMLGWIAMPYMSRVLVYPTGIVDVVLLLAKELSIGLLMGMSVRLIFYTLDAAAGILSVEIGLNPSPEFNPSNQGDEGNPLGSLLFYLGLVIFFSGAQYAVAFAFVRSFELVPPGLQVVSMDFVPLVVKHTGRVIELGVLMAAPAMAMNFLINLTFSILGRVVPKMHVFVLSYSLRTAAGLAMLITSVGLISHYILQEFGASPELMLHFLPFHVS